MAIVSKGSGGSIKFTGTGGGISITSSGGGGGGGGAPDASNLYSLLRRGVNQTSTVNDLTETVITSWTDARGAGLGYPKFVPKFVWGSGSSTNRADIQGDGSVNMRSGHVGGTFLRATTDDSNNPLSNVNNGSWTAYVRFKNASNAGNPFGTTTPVTGHLAGIFASTNEVYGDDAGADTSFAALYAGRPSWFDGNWRFRAFQHTGGGWTPVVNFVEVGNQYLPNPIEYQVAVFRVSPAQGWSFRFAHSGNGGGSFGSDQAYNINSGYPFNLGSVLWCGGRDNDVIISDYAIYKSYHDESTATQVISHLGTAP